MKPEAISNQLHCGRMWFAYKKLLPSIKLHSVKLPLKIADYFKEIIGYSTALIDPLQESYPYRMLLRKRQGLDPVPDRRNFAIAGIMLSFAISGITGLLVYFLI